MSSWSHMHTTPQLNVILYSEDDIKHCPLCTWISRPAKIWPFSVFGIDIAYLLLSFASLMTFCTSFHDLFGQIAAKTIRFYFFHFKQLVWITLERINSFLELRVRFSVIECVHINQMHKKHPPNEACAHTCIPKIVVFLVKLVAVDMLNSISSTCTFSNHYKLAGFSVEFCLKM